MSAVLDTARTLGDPVATWAGAREHFAAIGYTLPADGSTTWVRFPAAGKGERNRSAAARLTDDGAAVLLVDHAADLHDSYQHRTTRPLDPAAYRRTQEEAERRRVAREAERVERRTTAMARVQRTLARTLAGDAHPYVLGKGLASAHGALQLGTTLYVIGHDEHGAPAFAQRIDEVGGKMLTAGTSFTGAWVTFGTPTDDDPLVIATGWATAATLFEESGTATLAAMCDANLERVARISRRLHPHADIVIAGDDDRQNAHNGGRAAAEAAARAIDARLAFPAFCDACDGSCSDFADARECERRRAGGDR